MLISFFSNSPVLASGKQGSFVAATRDPACHISEANMRIFVHAYRFNSTHKAGPGRKWPIGSPKICYKSKFKQNSGAMDTYSSTTCKAKDEFHVRSCKSVVSSRALFTVSIFSPSKHSTTIEFDRRGFKPPHFHCLFSRPYAENLNFAVPCFYVLWIENS